MTDFPRFALSALVLATGLAAHAAALGATPEKPSFEVATIKQNTRAVPLRFSVPLGDLATGRDDCQVTVLDPTGQTVAFWRAPLMLVP
jgi:hypothetical protein